MKKGTVALIEWHLENYNNIEQMIEQKLEKLTHHSEKGKVILLTIQDDIAINNLRRFKQVIKMVLEKQPTETKRIIELRYMKERRTKWENIAEDVGLSPSICRKLNNEVIRKIANSLGLLI